MVSKARSIVVLEHGVRRKQNFDDDVINVGPQFVDVEAMFT